MAFKINPAHSKQALEWFLNIIQKAGLNSMKFIFGTDAHVISRLGCCGSQN